MWRLRSTSILTLARSRRSVRRPAGAQSRVGDSNTSMLAPPERFGRGIGEGRWQKPGCTPMRGSRLTWRRPSRRRRRCPRGRRGGSPRGLAGAGRGSSAGSGDGRSPRARDQPGALPVPVRLYRPTTATRPTVVYFHGGGWTIGSIETHDDVCRRFAAVGDVARCCPSSIGSRPSTHGRRRSTTPWRQPGSRLITRRRSAGCRPRRSPETVPEATSPRWWRWRSAPNLPCRCSSTRIPTSRSPNQARWRRARALA